MRFLSDARPAHDAARPHGLSRLLDVTEQQALLQYAREAVIDAVARGDLPRILRNDGIFAERCGVFVTLHIHQRLRGCIGVVEADEPLGSSLVRCAASAALSDPRFPPLRQDELPDLRIEISLLSPPEPIRPEAIEIGRHGLLIVSSRAHSRDERERGEGSTSPPSGAPPSVFEGGSSVKKGLLLPQVAVEHHLTAEQFLAETCRKANLPPDAWRQLAEASQSTPSPEDVSRIQLFAFTCQVFSET